MNPILDFRLAEKIREQKNVGLFPFYYDLGADEQQAKKIPRTGYIATRSGPEAVEKAFLEGLQSLGYIEGQTIAIEWRFAQEKFDRLPDLASELVRLKVDVIVTSGGYPTVQAVKNATTTIPIVMTGVSDAVELGFVSSASRWKYYRDIRSGAGVARENY